MWNPFKKKPDVVEDEVEKVKPKWAALANALSVAITEESAIRFYPAPQLPSGVVPDDVDLLAMDGFCTASQYADLDPQFYSSYIGYQQMARLAQSTEYRLVAETFSQEMTREWGVIKGEDTKKVELIEAEFKRLDIRGLIRKAIENDFYFGGSQIYIDIDGHDTKTDLPLMINEKGIPKGSLKGFIVREPMWSTPSLYNANDALRKDFFVPEMWWILGKNVHHSRAIPLVMRPVPDMLKPAYNFYGVSMIQLMLPYVQRFQSIADSVAKLITMFSLTGVKTDMSSILSAEEGGANTMINRFKTLALMRDNQGVVALDKETEEIFQINTPLSGLDVIVDKFTQMIAYPSKIPVLKIFGTPTAGLGNTSDGEIRVFYDCVSAQQEAFILPIINKMLRCVQLSLFGEIDEEIEFKFNPLYQLDEVQQSQVELNQANTDATYVNAGILDGSEVRQRLSSDESSRYENLEVNNPLMDDEDEENAQAD